MIAAELMTVSPRTMQPTDTVSQAVDVLDTMNIRHLPIVDDRGHLVGMLSDRDLGPLMRVFIEGAEAERMVVPLSERRISELMTGDVISVELDADVLEVVALMVEERVGAVPVVDEADNVRGIISYVDVLQALATSTVNPERSS